jgi:hypothetical protein
MARRSRDRWDRKRQRQPETAVPVSDREATLSTSRLPACRPRRPRPQFLGPLRETPSLTARDEHDPSVAAASLAGSMNAWSETSARDHRGCLPVKRSPPVDLCRHGDRLTLTVEPRAVAANTRASAPVRWPTATRCETAEPAVAVPAACADARGHARRRDPCCPAPVTATAVRAGAKLLGSGSTPRMRRPAA